MPEGPEVETIRRGLELALVGQEITDVDVLFAPSFPTWEGLCEQMLQKAIIHHVGRRGKVLIIELESDYTLLIHLKMTGQMVLVKRDGERFAGGHPSESMAGDLPDRSTRVIFHFASGDRMFFNDQRKFGWIKLVHSDEVSFDSLLSRLGPEVLSEEFTSLYLKSQLKRHARAPVKAVILDQSVVAGIGNIYADESLHLARIHPARAAGSLSPVELRRLYSTIRVIIALGIEYGGTSFSHYVNSLGGRGDYLAHARVFRRQGLPCGVCGATIQKIRVAGRGTHICPKCQKLTKSR
ncbi:MAG TPA: bifunctional DNA-formamidopyrimidine glycosylase/DNA-(apurinic or apyrimidinic site) lyase [Candidatus Saccharimonadia bacterium]|nr:bifunctional DNA-formamidopyrimidine glycosylase/DNA-(apurinic or apyrimidinic site) lyase [Candidatus Saccharimonadia bacterium]